MIDLLIGRNSERKHSTYDLNYSPKDVVAGEQLTNLNADILTVVFPSWHSNDIFDKALDHRLASHGSAVYRPEINNQILEPNVDRVVASFIQLQKTVSDRIYELVSQNKYNSVRLLAMSLGNVSLALVAEAYPDFDRANMMMAGSSLARSLWQGERTQSLRSLFGEQGVTEESLDEAWISLAPKTHADCFSGKSVDLLVSKNDKVIPTALQYEMVNELANSGANSSVRYTELGHYMSIITRSLVTI